MRNLAPAFSLKGSSIEFVPNTDNLSYSDLAEQKIVKIADGGPVDNSGVAQIVSFLQLNNQADDFNIVAFDNVTSALKMDGTSEARVGTDIANLFGQGLCPDNQFCMFSCEKDETYGCVQVPSLQVFEAASLFSTPTTLYKTKDGMELIYTQYQVTTTDNKAYNIKAGTKGTLHAFTCIAPNANTAPEKKDFTGYYEMFNFIHNSLNDPENQGVKLLQRAFGLSN